ncbi:hypothetical protein RCL1_004732 [Eukaryota sp. TZLM3-RCL]
MPDDFSSDVEDEEPEVIEPVFTNQPVLIIGCLLCSINGDNSVTPNERVIFCQPDHVLPNKIKTFCNECPMISVNCCSNEEQLLQGFIAWFNNKHISLIVGYNVSRFDLLNIFTRCTILKITDCLSIDQGQIWCHPCYVSYCSFDENYPTVLVLDMLVVVRDFFNFQSLGQRGAKLDVISQSLCIGTKASDSIIHANEDIVTAIHRIMNRKSGPTRDKEFVDFINYCVTDVVLVFNLYHKLKEQVWQSALGQSGFKSVRTHLATFVKPEVAEHINKDMVSLQRFSSFATLFLKVFILSEWYTQFDSNNGKLPKLRAVNDSLVVSEMSHVLTSYRNGFGTAEPFVRLRPSNEYNALVNCYDEIFHSAIPTSYPFLSVQNLSRPLQYWVRSNLSVNFRENVKKHFVSHLTRWLNVFLRKRENLYLNRSDKVKKHKFLTDFNNVRDLVIRGQKFKTKYFTIHLQNIESWLHTDDINDPRTKNSFIQHLKVLDLPKGSVKGVYSLKSKIGTANYIAFISRSIYLMKNIQEISDYLKSVNSSKPFKPLMIYNAIPLRTSSVPAHFQYDTKGIHTVITVSGIKEERFNQNDDKKVWLTVIKPHFVTHENAHVLGESNQNVSMHELQLQQATDNSTITNSKWASTRVLNCNSTTNTKNPYDFDYSINTNGVSCVVRKKARVLKTTAVPSKRVTKSGKPFESKNLELLEHRRRNVDTYFQNIPIDQRQSLTNKRIIVIDPNIHDVIVAGSKRRGIHEFYMKLFDKMSTPCRISIAQSYTTSVGCTKVDELDPLQKSILKSLYFEIEQLVQQHVTDLFVQNFVDVEFNHRTTLFNNCFNSIKSKFAEKFNTTVVHNSKWQRRDEWIIVRYSTGQRKYEGRWMQLNAQLAELKRQHEVKKGVERCKQVTDALALTNKRSVRTEEFLQYVSAKLAYDAIYQEFYEDTQVREINFQRKRLIQKSEFKLLKKFESTFGPKDQCIVIFGDWTPSKTRTFRGKAPSMGVGTRLLLARGGFFVRVEDEWGTSINCHNCLNNSNFKEGRNDYMLRYEAAADPILKARQRRLQKACEAIRRRDNMEELIQQMKDAIVADIQDSCESTFKTLLEERLRENTTTAADVIESNLKKEIDDAISLKIDLVINPERKIKVRTVPITTENSASKKGNKVHGLLKCLTCGSIWDRDFNPILNMYKIVESYILYNSRPLRLDRKRKETKD